MCVSVRELTYECVRKNVCERVCVYVRIFISFDMPSPGISVFVYFCPAFEECVCVTVCLCTPVIEYLGHLSVPLVFSGASASMLSNASEIQCSAGKSC